MNRCYFQVSLYSGSAAMELSSQVFNVHGYIYFIFYICGTLWTGLVAIFIIVYCVKVVPIQQMSAVLLACREVVKNCILSCI
jgi:uncharacterized membrane protein YccC